MRGNSHVRFLGGRGLAMGSSYPPETVISSCPSLPPLPCLPRSLPTCAPLTPLSADACRRRFR